MKISTSILSHFSSKLKQLVDIWRNSLNAILFLDASIELESEKMFTTGKYKSQF